MSDLVQQLEHAGRQLQPEIQRRLGGLLGGIVRAYLPQVWMFRTDHGTASLTVSAAGEVSVAEGAVEHPDVTIEIPWELLHAALTKRSPEGIPHDRVKVTPHSAKGRAAFDYLRGRIGL
jgi:hypothetical protein